MAAESVKARIAILISGRGSNMMALADAVRDGTIPNAEITVVISNQRTAAGLARAKARGIEALVIERRGRTREEHDREVIEALRVRQIELVCLAGYMRVLSSQFVNAFRGRILNIHPSLLPAFRGLEAQKQALESGVEFTGCSVHFVDDTLDGGLVILQRTVDIAPDDTVETLAERILAEEHQIYPQAVKAVLEELRPVD